MAWTPSLINGGLFENCPQSNMTVPFDNALHIGSLNEYNHAITASYSASQKFEPTKWDGAQWSAARGRHFSDKLISLWDNHHGDPAQTDVVLAAVTIQNPTGAQFYKQELVVYGSYSSTNITRTYGHWGDEEHYLDYYQGDVAITRIARREYATPTAIPTVTNLNVSTVGVNPMISVGGEILCEPLFYFLTSGMFTAGYVHYNQKYYYGFGFFESMQRDYSLQESTDHRLIFSGIALEVDYLEEVFGGSFEPEESEDPNEEPDEPGGGGGESGEGGGEDGDHDKTQDPVPYPNDPPIGGASGGFVTLYRCTVGEMQTFAKKMFEFDILQALKNIFADPMDMVAGVMIVPFRPDTSGVARPVVHLPSPAPDITWDNWYNVITDQYQDIDCGSLTITKYYDSCFDYNPYTRLLLYLPYLGYKELDPDEVMGQTIQVKYKVDCMTGDCVAFVIRNIDGVSQCIGQYSGNCGVRVAFGRASFDSAIAASIQLITGIATGAIKGAGGAISAFMAGAAGNSASDESETLAQGQLASGAGAAASGVSMPTVQQMKTQTIKSGVMGANAGFISVQKPHIIRFVPNQSRPANYRALHGYPANIAGPIGSGGFRGYMELDTIELDGINATETEKNEIAALCKGGILYGNI